MFNIRFDDKILNKLFNSLTVLILIFLFIENFIYSKDFFILGLREIDDVAFHTTLRKIHLFMYHGAWSKLFILNDYAYGWVYWIAMSVLTYPFFLLSSSFQVDWPLIVVTREISLLFGTLSLILLRKILIDMKLWSIVISALGLIFVLFPTFGYYSLRFGTVNAIMFFSILSFYYIQKELTVRNITLALISLAVSGAIKLSGLFIAPFIGMKIVKYMYDHGFFFSLKKLILPSFVVVFTFIVFTNPALLLAPFNQNYLKDYLNIIKHFIEVTKMSHDNLHSFIRFYQGAFTTATQLVMAVIMIGGLIRLVLRRDETRRITYIAILLTLSIGSSYLLFSVSDANSMGRFFTSIQFLLLFGFLAYYQIFTSNFYKIFLLAIVSLMLYDIIHRGYQQYKYDSSSLHHSYYFFKKDKEYQKITIVTEIKNHLINKIDSNSSLHFLIDYTLPMAFNSLSLPNKLITYSWDNLSEKNKYYQNNVDFIILDKKSKGFFERNKFDELLKKVDDKIKNNYLVDRDTRLRLATQGEFDNNKYRVFYENDDFIIYKNDSTKLGTKNE